MNKSIKYAICNFDLRSGRVLDDDGSLVWESGTLETAMNKVKKDKSKCALFFPSDIPDYGAPLNRDVSREDFEREPAKYGVCYYKAWSGYAFE